MYELERRLPSLTRGEAVLECAFDRYEPVRSDAPGRLRTDHDPLHRDEYLLHVMRRVQVYWFVKLLTRVMGGA